LLNTTRLNQLLS